MSLPHDPSKPPDSHDHVEPTSFWNSRAGIYLIAILVIAGFLLGYEHRAHIFSGTLLLWLPLLLCVGMHFFMHGGHGGHGSGGGER